MDIQIKSGQGFGDITFPDPNGQGDGQDAQDPKAGPGNNGQDNADPEPNAVDGPGTDPQDTDDQGNNRTGGGDQHGSDGADGEPTEPADVEDQDGNDGADQLDEDQLREEFGEIAPVFSRLHSQGIIEVGEEEIEPTEETLAQTIASTIDRRSEQKYLEQLEHLPSQVRELMDVGLKGGDLREYFSRFVEKDYSSMEVTGEKANPETQKNVIRDFYRGINWNDKAIDEAIADFEKSGLLEKQAKQAKESLVQRTEAEKQQHQQELERRQQEQEQARQEYVDSVHTSVKGLSNVMGNIVTDEDRKNLREYMLRPDQDGYTPFQKDLNFNPEAQAKIAFLLLKNFSSKGAENKGARSAGLKFRKKMEGAHPDRSKKPKTGKGMRFKDPFKS